MFPVCTGVLLYFCVYEYSPFVFHSPRYFFSCRVRVHKEGLTTAVYFFAMVMVDLALLLHWYFYTKLAGSFVGLVQTHALALVATEHKHD